MLLLRTAVLSVCVALGSAGAAQERERASPAGGLRARFAGEDQTSSGWIPVELYLGSYVYLRGALNGVEVDVVLDSGAGMTVVDAALAGSLGIAETGSARAAGVGGNASATLLGEIELELGSLSLALPGAVAIDLAGVETLLGRGMPVILGQEVFDAFVVDLDYPRSRVAFHAPRSFAYEGPGRSVELQRWQGRGVIEAGVEELPPARFAVDTGSNQAVDLFEAFFERHALLAGRAPISARQAGGVGGTIVTEIATLSSFTLGGYRVPAVPAGFARAREGAFDTAEIAGNLGAGLLKRFRVIFDYSRARLTLEPGPEWDTRPFRKDRIGLSGTFEDGGIVVNFVAPDSPAEEAGWKAGQRITAIDGEPVDEAAWRAALSRSADSPSGTEIALTDGEGRERTLIAADYY